MKLAEVDHNFAASKAEDGLCYLDVGAHPELYYGLKYSEDRGFYRMEQEIADTVNEPVRQLAPCTAGGRLRLITDSRRIGLQVTLQNIMTTTNIAYIGTAGFDIYRYVDGVWQFIAGFAPGEGDYYSRSVELPGSGMQQLMLHFPLYAGVKKLGLGLDPEAQLEVLPYPDTVQVIFYGSSITQGGCAARPGTSYTNILSAWMDMEYRNLGFSAGARGEKNITDYIIAQPMRALVIDYDHNAPGHAHLEKTHYAMYRQIRDARPDLPILLASAPVIRLDQEWGMRREIIRTTYERALSEGDTRIRFVDGNRYFPPECAEYCMEDQWHPNDMGMYYMARSFKAQLEALLLG